MSDDLRLIVQGFFDAWENGPAAIRQAYDRHLSSDCVYENSGLPPLIGKVAILTFLDQSFDKVDFASLRVEVTNWGFGPGTVFTERADVHYDAEDNITFAPLICGVMKVNDQGLIARWADYFDPSAMLAQFAER